MHKHTIGWFEIPTLDINRAQKFYETILDIKMQVQDFPQIKMRLFPTDGENQVGGSLVSTSSPGFYIPSDKMGPLLYINGNPDIQTILDKVIEAGGKISIPKTQISEDKRFIAVIIDSEGNRIGLHSK